MADNKFEWSDESVKDAVKYWIDKAGSLGFGEALKKFKEEKTKVNRDWEVLAYKCDWLGERDVLFWRGVENSMIYFPIPNKHPFKSDYSEQTLKDNKATIHSVKRLSDGKVFSVGGFMRWNNCNCARIEGFEISSNNGHLLAKHLHGGVSLNRIESEKPKPLFNWVVFTEDGFGFPTWEKKDWRGDTRDNWDESVKTFEKASEADDFILYNKPCLSVNDILKLNEEIQFHNRIQDSEVCYSVYTLKKRRLIELAKNKAI